MDAATMKNSVEFPQSPSRYLSERNKDINLKKITSTPMSIAAYIYNSQDMKATKVLDEWIEIVSYLNMYVCICIYLCIYTYIHS